MQVPIEQTSPLSALTEPPTIKTADDAPQVVIKPERKINTPRRRGRRRMPYGAYSDEKN